MSRLESSHSSFRLAVGLVMFLLPVQAVLASTNKSGAPRSKPATAKNHSAASSHPKSANRGDKVSGAQERLAALGYWTSRVDGVVDPGSRNALIAFQKAEGLPRTGRLSPADLKAISQAVPIAPRERGYYHVEVDLDHQILFFVDDNGRVSNVLPISTGGGEEFTSEGWTREAITPRGRFQVHDKIAGWHKGPLGRIYYPNYILGSLAIHGYPSVPVHPASHGCIRIPMFAARRFSEMTPVGTVVLVYGSRRPGIESLNH